MKKTVLIASLALALGSSTAFAGATAKQAAAAINDAVMANNKAASIGFEWRDTYKKLLGPAKKAYKKGDYDKAMKLSATAKSHAELGMIQADMGKNADLVK